MSWHKELFRLSWPRHMPSPSSLLESHLWRVMVRPCPPLPKMTSHFPHLSENTRGIWTQYLHLLQKRNAETTILTGLVNRWQKSCVAGYAMSWQLPFSYRINLQLWNLLPHKLYFRCTSMAEDLCACANLGTLWKFVISYQLVLRTLVGVRLGIARLG